MPVEKLLPLYSNLKTVDDVPELTLRQIQHFFEHYKDLEKGKWVKLDGWGGAEEAKQILRESMTRYEASAEKPKF